MNFSKNMTSLPAGRSFSARKITKTAEIHHFKAVFLLRKPFGCDIL
jgi:hypothetical protein